MSIVIPESGLLFIASAVISLYLVNENKIKKLSEGKSKQKPSFKPALSKIIQSGREDLCGESVRLDFIDLIDIVAVFWMIFVFIQLKVYVIIFSLRMNLMI